MRLSEYPLIHEAAIQRRIVELARTITADYQGNSLVLIVVLRGAMFFAADLLRALETPFLLDFVRAKSYAGTQSTGLVELLTRPETDMRDQHVLIVEDILDTGRTTSVLFEHFAQQQPASLRLCTLLDKPSRRIAQVQADYIGFEIEDQFVVGYGLDHKEAHRGLRSIFVLETE